MKRVRTFSGFVVFGAAFLLLQILFPQKIEAKIGEGLELIEGKPLNIKAESLIYLSDKDLFVAEGSVEVTYQKSRLTADRVEFNKVTGKALAIGNVFYEEEGETLSADQVELNFDSEWGMVYIGELALEDDHYITGEEIEKIEENTYLIRKGSYTACRPCKNSSPAWQFRSSRAKVEQGEYLQAWNTVGYVKGIPVFYFPYFIFPIKTERQTGFLVPDIGKSSSQGFSITNTFFWAISDSQDATLSHTYYEEQGHKFDLEYQYKYSKKTDGTFTGKFVRDKIEHEERKQLSWNHRHGLPYAIKALVNLNLSSDDQFAEGFEVELEEHTSRKLQSKVSFTRKFSSHSMHLLFDHSQHSRQESVEEQDILQEEFFEEVDQYFPEFRFTSQKQQLFNSPLYVEQKTRISRLKRETTEKTLGEEGKEEEKEKEELDFVRVDIRPTLSLSLNIIPRALTVNPSLQLYETYYTRDAETASDPDLDAKPVHREYYTARVGVNGPKLNRIFDLGKTRRTQRLKHLIEPHLSFYYAPGINEEDFPYFDSIDNVGSENRSRTMSYGITQRLLAKRVKESDWKKFLDDDEDVFVEDLSTNTKELASFSVEQSYNFEADEEKFSEIEATLEIQPFDDYTLELDAEYDVYLNTFVETDVELQGILWNFLNFGVRWSRELEATSDQREVDQDLVVNTRFNLFERVGVTYQGRFDLEKGERTKDNITITYNAQCWNIVGNYWQYLYSDERHEGFGVRLDLTHIGKLFNIKRSE